MRFLLDTNVISAPLRPDPDRSILAKLRLHEGATVTAAPVWHELRYGCSRLPDSRRRRLVDEYLREVVTKLDIVPYDAAAAEWHAVERARLGAAGKTSPFVDGQIAAIAAVNGLVLVTGNVRHYRQFRGLTVEDWSD